MKKVLSYLFVFIIVLSQYQNCFSQTYLEKDLKKYISERSFPDINKFILDKVSNNRVVMLADAGHGKHVFMQTVIDYLNYWLDTLKCTDALVSNIPRKLYLILENDSIRINNLYRYFETNDPSYLLYPELIFGDQFTSAVIEFCDDLSRINKRVNLLNNDLPDKNKISFRIVGPEKILDMNNWTTSLRDSFYLFERDQYSSDQIIKLLEKDTLYRSIIFYGGAHLQVGKVKKLPNYDILNYFMAYYLTEYFAKKGGVYTIYQMQFDWLSNTYKWTDNNYALENSIFESCYLPRDMSVMYTNATLVLNNKELYQPHISYIWGNNLVDLLFNYTNEPHNFKSEYTKGIIGGLLYYLHCITGQELRRISLDDSTQILEEVSKWKNWRKDFNNNMAEEIINQSIITNLIKLFEQLNYPTAWQYEYYLMNILHAKTWLTHDDRPVIKAAGYYDYLKKYSKQIITENLINLLWVATPKERKTALEYLKSTQSKDFNTAKEWTDWWRNGGME